MAPRTTPVIAIVDDDESVRAATGLLVASLGYATHAFSSAEEFLRSPRIDDTSCLILDVHMPCMSGTQLHTLLRERGLRIPTIFITAYPRDGPETRVAEAICLLAKPFTAAALVRCIEAALEPG